MAIHSSRMTVVVPPTTTITEDTISSQVRPHLGRVGVQTWGLTRHLSPTVYSFGIEVEGAKWQTVWDTLAAARQMLQTTYGLETTIP